jgi:hypothetical protein
VWVDRFYNGVEAAEQRMAGFQHLGQTLDRAEVQRYFKTEGKDWAWYALQVRGEPLMTGLRKVRTELGEVNKAMAEVQGSPKMAPATKREKLIELSRMRDKLAEAGFKMYLSPGDQRRQF